jgi:hypothetical protein
VNHFLVAEYTFLQVYFQMILLWSFKHLFQNLEMSFVSVRVDQEVVNVDNYILEVPEYTFHESLKRGWASQQSHW